MSFRGIFWTLINKTRHWYLPPLDALIFPDYVVLFWAPTEFTREALPIKLVIQNKCEDCVGTKIYSFHSNRKRTRMTGSGGNRRQVTSPQDLDAMVKARVFEDLNPNGFQLSPASGEFSAYVNGTYCAIDGSGIFWDMILRWIIPGEAGWYVTDDDYLPAYATTVQYPIVFDYGTTDVSDPYSCFDICAFISSIDPPVPDPGLFGLIGTPTRIFVFRNAQITGGSGLQVINVPVGSESLLSSQAKGLIDSDPAYSGGTSEIIEAATAGNLDTTILVKPQGKFLSLNQCKIESTDPTCYLTPEHKVLWRYVMKSCAAPDPDQECGGRLAGWYLSACVQWEFPPETINQLCFVQKIADPIGLPFEGNEAWEQLLNLGVSALMSWINEQIASLLGTVVNNLPPNLRIIGRLLYATYEALNIQFTAEVFFCEPESLCADEESPSVLPVIP